MAILLESPLGCDSNMMRHNHVRKEFHVLIHTFGGLCSHKTKSKSGESSII